GCDRSRHGRADIDTVRRLNELIDSELVIRKKGWRGFGVVADRYSLQFMSWMYSHGMTMLSGGDVISDQSSGVPSSRLKRGGRSLRKHIGI
ncbi:hypothetical protein, partial [Pseudomonas syringae]|uniref:hypothetical protein n=1 Tax=Pseudomonas syringae TaxID=317 RepID=UPI001FEE05D5